MLHRRLLSFTGLFSHLSVHQDNRTKFENLPCKAQLNCVERALLSLDANNLPWQQKFPLEAIYVWAGREKMTSDTGHHIRYHAPCHLARGGFAVAGVLTNTQLDLVDWQMVHNILYIVPRMFQIWACKQVWSIAPTNHKLLHWMTTSPLCPSCMQVTETCVHVLHYNHASRVEALLATTKLLDQWMKTCATDPDLRECIYEYAIGQGGVTVEAICTDNRYYGHYRLMARAKDAIRWQQFMVGMI